MKNHHEAEAKLNRATRYYLCNQHQGALALLELSNTIQESKEILPEQKILETIEQFLREPPGYKDPQNCEASIAVKIMKMQHVLQRAVEKVEITSKEYEETEYPSWSVKLQFKEESIQENEEP